jgi:hypothetical protein
MENAGKITDNDDKAMTTLGGMGDRELWYAEGEPDKNDPEGRPAWRFPLFVDWKVAVETGIEYASIFPAVCPHYRANLLLKALFEVHDFVGRENQWLVRREVVPALLKKAPGISPGRYYRWDGKDQKATGLMKETVPSPQQNRRDEPFHIGGGDRLLIQQIAAEAGVQTSIVKIVLAGLSKVAADYLVSQHRVMDLGFIRIIAVPFRANWKEIVTFKLRKLGLLKYLKEDERGNAACNGNNAGLPETLCSPHNVGIVRESKRKGYQTLSRVDYSLEVITSKTFEKEVTKLETRERSAGQTAYVRHYEKTVERLYENILEILRAYRKKIGLPFARICESSGTGGLRFMETVGIKARAHGRNLRDLPVHIVPPTEGFSARAEESEPLLVHSPAVEVPKLPTFSSSTDDVWQCPKPGSLEEFLDGGSGAGGLPLLPPDQSEAAGQPVLPCSTLGRESSGVDEKGD